jgi:hypothetical protein
MDPSLVPICEKSPLFSFPPPPPQHMTRAIYFCRVKLEVTHYPGMLVIHIDANSRERYSWQESVIRGIRSIGRVNCSRPSPEQPFLLPSPTVTLITCPFTTLRLLSIHYTMSTWWHGPYRKCRVQEFYWVCIRCCRTCLLSRCLVTIRKEYTES